MATAGDKITDALKLIGVLAPGETASGPDAADALSTFNAFLDYLQTQRLSIYNQARSVYDLVAGTATYTIGSGATFNQARPIWIDRVGILDTANSERQIPIVTDGEWARIPDKATQGTPALAHYNPTYANGVLSLYPVPDSSTLDVVLYWPSASVTSVAALTTALSIPPGYGRMFTYALARELAILFGKSVDPRIEQIADESMAAIKRANIRPEVLTFDRALSGRRKTMTNSRFEGGNW